MRRRLAWAVGAAAALGVAAGLGAFTFVYAKGASYLTTDAASCANCHIMEEHYSAWIKSSHRNVAKCADCHMPHDVVGKYAAKASNGFWHSLAFTTGRFPDPLQIKPHNRAITERTCRDCHDAIVDQIDAHGFESIESSSADKTERPSIHDGARVEGAGEFSCIRCHTYVGHMVR
ncbi:MAG: cytochrome c nitrite reductase small subunit [Gemmatimonadaceae bacterium]